MQLQASSSFVDSALKQQIIQLTVYRHCTWRLCLQHSWSAAVQIFAVVVTLRRRLINAWCRDADHLEALHNGRSFRVSLFLSYAAVLAAMLQCTSKLMPSGMFSQQCSRFVQHSGTLLLGCEACACS